MRALVIGANGKIGRKVVEKLLHRGHKPVAMLREKEQSVYFHEIGAETVFADLEEGIDHAFKEIDAVVFTAGSGSDTGKDKTELVDRMGAIKAIDEAVKHNVHRFIMVSALGADYDPQSWPEEMVHYYQAKAVADRYLAQTDLNYTILKPGRLTDDFPTGKIELAEHVQQGAGSVSRGDVAETIVQLLAASGSIGKAYELLQGNKRIEEAIAEL